MKINQGRQEKILQTLNRICNSDLKENSHIYPDFKRKISIKEAAEFCLKNQKEQDLYPAIIFIRVVLAANRDYNKHVRDNLEKIKKLYPKLKSFNDLKNLIDQMKREDFYKLWGHNNLRKYNVLNNLLYATITLRERYKIQDDFKLMQKWAEEVNLKKLKNDEIGKIKDIAVATVQHLRMDFGIDTVKPDQRVLEVIQREFLYKKVSQKQAIKFVEELSTLSGLKTRLIDLILVNYGSGYYDNRKYSSRYMVQIEIAKNLINLEVDNKIIAIATEINLDSIKELKENFEEQSVQRP